MFNVQHSKIQTESHNIIIIIIIITIIITFRMRKPNRRYRVFSYLLLESRILSNGKGHFGPSEPK